MTHDVAEPTARAPPAASFVVSLLTMSLYYKYMDIDLRALLNVLIGIFVTLVGWWVVKHPNRSKKHPGRTRLPKIIPIVGWMLIVVGAFFGLITLAIPDPEIGMYVSAIAMFVGGILFTLMYRNFYVAPETDAVHFRTILGKEQVIEYRDIINVQAYEMRGQPYVRVTGSNGAKLELNPQMYDLQLMFNFLENQGSNRIIE